MFYARLVGSKYLVFGCQEKEIEIFGGSWDHLSQVGGQNLRLKIKIMFSMVFKIHLLCTVKWHFHL